MKPFLPADNDEFAHENVALRVRLDSLRLIQMRQLLLQQFLFLYLQVDHIDADDDFENSFPQREYIFEFFPFKILHEELAKNADLSEPDDVIKEIVVETANAGTDFENLQDQPHL